MLLPYNNLIAYSTVTMKLLGVFVCMLYFFGSFILFFLTRWPACWALAFSGSLPHVILILFVIQLWMSNVANKLLSVSLYSAEYGRKKNWKSQEVGDGTVRGCN